jgi:prolyl-tRNA synthetase
MKYSQLFPKTLREAPSGAEAVNHKLLVRGGFMDQLMAGSWTLLPFGLRVVSKINDIIREELNKTGASEMVMPLLHPKEVWARSGRWDDPGVQEIMYRFKDQHEREYCLSFTHEEIVMDLLGKYNLSYKDFPVKIYQFSTKFRNEVRAKSGILRGREFLMKDLYSAHISEADMFEYYNRVKEAYVRIFERIGFGIKVVEASGGVFTDKHTHEFQVIADSGEDTIYFCNSCDFAQNKEIFEGKTGEKCVRCGKGVIEEAKSIEVGNIFPLGTKYSETMKVFYRDEQDRDQPIWFASYGIGPTRVMGTLVEVFNDDRGIIWPESVAPFQVHLIGLDMEDVEINNKAEEVYNRLKTAGVDVLFDDRNIRAGEKFADADLIGIPLRVVVSKKTEDKIEVRKRPEKETRFISLEELISETGA